MREILEDHALCIASDPLQAFGRSVEARDRGIELRITDAQQVADMARAFHVLQVVLPEDLQGHIAQVRLQHGGAVVDAVLGYPVTDALRPHLRRFGYPAHLGIFAAIDQLATRLDHIDEQTELVHIALEGLEHVDVVPSDAADQCDVRSVEVEFGHGL